MAVRRQVHHCTLCTEKALQIAGQVEPVHAADVRANMRSILVAMMKSFSCSPLLAGAGDELQVGTRRLLSECYFPIFEHVHDINDPRPPARPQWTNHAAPLIPA